MEVDFSKSSMDALSSIKDSHTEIWDDESTETLILYYFVNINIFKGSSQEEADIEWESIATQLFRTKESCKAYFNTLQNTYLETARTQVQDNGKLLDVTDVDWPYFDIFVKICQFDGANQTNHTSQTSQNIQEIELALLQYYLKHKQLFENAQFGGKIRLWSLVAGQMEISPEECANKLNSIKYRYMSKLDNLPIEKNNDIESAHNTLHYRLCSKIFYPDACEEDPDREMYANCNQLVKVKNEIYTARKVRWQHSDVRRLLEFYSDNFQSFEAEPFRKELWAPIAQDLDRTETECHQKISDLLKKHKKYVALKLQKPNSRVCWRYYDVIEQVYKNNKFQPEYLHNNTYINSEDMLDEIEDHSSEHCHNNTHSENNQGSDGLVLPSNDEVEFIRNDDDYICIVVAPQDEELNDLKNVPSLKTNKLTEPNHKMQNNSSLCSHNVKILHKRKEISFDVKETKCKWSKRAKQCLLRLYKDYLMQNSHRIIKETDLWISIGSQMHRSPYHCREAFLKMKEKHSQYLKQVNKGKQPKWPHFHKFKAINRLKPLFSAENINLNELMIEMKPEIEEIRDSCMKDEVVEKILTYYLDNLEQFVNPKYYKMYVWGELCKAVGVDRFKCLRKFKYLHNFYNELKLKTSVDNKNWPYFEIFELITAKENDIKKSLSNDPTLIESNEKREVLGFDLWDDNETEKLLEWFLSKADQFRNPKYINKYLWREAQLALGLSADRCSKKMRDMRAIYRSHLKGLNNGTGTALDWKYFPMCSKIYGTRLKDPFLARTKRPRGKATAFNDSDQVC